MRIENDTTNGTKGIGVLERQLSIVEAIAASGDGLFLSEIGEALDLPRATVHRLIASLVDVGLVASRGRGRRSYVVGPRLIRLVHGEFQTSRIQRLAEPVLRGLVERFQETSYLTRLSGVTVRSVAMTVPERDWHGHVHPGNEMAIHASASGKAIFAFQSEDVVERALRLPLTKFTRFTKTDPAAVRRELEVVKRQKYAACREEIDLGLVAYACPIEVAGVGVIYSVGVAGPVSRMGERSENTFVAGLRAAADDLAVAIGRISRIGPRRQR